MGMLICLPFWFFTCQTAVLCLSQIFCLTGRAAGGTGLRVFWPLSIGSLPVCTGSLSIRCDGLDMKTAERSK